MLFFVKMLNNLFSNKSVKAKEKVAELVLLLQSNTIKKEELIEFANQANAVNKASCIEAIEKVTHENSAFCDELIWAFVTDSLLDKEPRIKWESARVIANSAKECVHISDTTLKNLFTNIRHEGKVVRWATAMALCSIALQSKNKSDFLKTELIRLPEMETEESIRKKYTNTLKKIK